ncbi:MAG: hypothetical protein NVSMB17_17050 [Candidatus Dormibacteria bacterium]
MPAASTEDAHLYIELMKLIHQPNLTEASDWVVGQFDAATHKDLQSKYPPGSAERGQLVAVLGFYESVGMLVSRGLIHEDVFFDVPFRFEVIWPRVEPLILDWQKVADDTAVWENVVWLARRYENWRETVWRRKAEAIPTDRPPTKQWGETTGHVGFTRG